MACIDGEKTAAIAQTRGKHAPECVRACAYFRVHNSLFYASFERDEDRIA